MRSSMAPLRVELSRDAHWPFANITLRPGDHANRLKDFMLAAQLWRAGGHTIPIKWVRITPTQENVETATTLLASRGALAQDTCLFVWQSLPEEVQSKSLHLAKDNLAREHPHKTVVVMHTGSPVADAQAPPPAVEERFPCLQALDLSSLVGFFSVADRVMGANGPLLHLASITDTDVEGYFLSVDAPYDTSFLNPRFHVNYLEKQEKE
jgi:hypothetical protein